MRCEGSGSSGGPASVRLAVSALLLALVTACGAPAKVAPAEPVPPGAVEPPVPEPLPPVEKSVGGEAAVAKSPEAAADEEPGEEPLAEPAAAAEAPAPAITAGNPSGAAGVPAEAQAVDTSRPDQVVGDGTPASCMSAAVVEAVGRGGIITFDCGPDPVTIEMTATAKVRNDANPLVVLDGGGKVTLSGGGQRRILYLNTCDQAQVWTTAHCDDQDHPRLTVQHIAFTGGNATGETIDGGGGGAIYVRGGRFKAVNTRFTGNACDATGPDVGGAAIRVLDQYQDLPVYVVGSTFGGAPGQGNRCSNGAALSSIGVSWVVLNSVFSHNEAIGAGANPARPGTPGGGSGGAIYLDGNTFSLRVAGTVIEDNRANEGGGAVFFVSNDRSGSMHLEDSTLRRNPSAGFETDGLPGIFFLGAAAPTTTGTVLD